MCCLGLERDQFWMGKESRGKTGSLTNNDGTVPIIFSASIILLHYLTMPLTFNPVIYHKHSWPILKWWWIITFFINLVLHLFHASLRPFLTRPLMSAWILLVWLFESPGERHLCLFFNGSTNVTVGNWEMFLKNSGPNAYSAFLKIIFLYWGWLCLRNMDYKVLWKILRFQKKQYKCMFLFFQFNHMALFDFDRILLVSILNLFLISLFIESSKFKKKSQTI